MTPDQMLSRVDAGGICWLWQGAISSTGYGSVVLNGRKDSTHRAMWELLVGEIPAGLHMDHLCRVRRCCNPDHLEPVTRQENAARGYPHRNPTPEACPQGHEYTAENRIVYGPQKHVKCRICTNRSQREQYRKRRDRNVGRK